jgi:hypothetical protein
VAATAAAPATNWRRLKLAAVSDSVLSHPQAQLRIGMRDLPSPPSCRFMKFSPLTVHFSGLLDQNDHTLTMLPSQTIGPYLTSLRVREYFGPAAVSQNGRFCPWADGRTAR